MGRRIGGDRVHRGPGLSWSPTSYLRYADERALPFVHLVAAVRHPGPRYVVDLGCGPGGLTASLLERWPDAEIVGVDGDADMIGHARRREVPGRLTFARSDVRDWRCARAPDVILSNACLHWIPGHLALVAELGGSLAPGGVLAFQVPDSFDQPSHRAVAEVRARPRWRDRLAGVAPARVEPLDRYVDTLHHEGLVALAWRTTYHHVLTGPDPVLEWLRGSTLRPVLAALGTEDGERFCAELAPRLREAYPSGPNGTVLPFRRLFVVASRP